MEKDQSRSSWSKLDNTGKVFPAISSDSASNVFRFYAVLNEEVNPLSLGQAVLLATQAVPSFQVKLRRGLFWYYFEYNDRTPAIRQESDYPCRPVYRENGKGFLFEVTYFQDRINLEVYHVLADGAGAIYFLNVLLYFYMKLQHPELELPELGPELQAPVEEQQEDGFARYYDETAKPISASLDRKEAYPILGTGLPVGCQKVIEARVPVREILSIAKGYGATVTEYLAAELFYSIYEGAFKKDPRNLPITISVPVNLRGFFPSRTLKNFFIFVRIPVSFYEREPSFEEVLAEVHRQMGENITREKFLGRIRYQVELERKWFFRIIPRPIKDLGVRFGYHLGEKAYTCTLTNLGRIHLPREILSYVDRVGVILGASANNVLKVGIGSFEDVLTFNFCTTIRETEIQRVFLTRLAGHGVDVQISTNLCEHEGSEPNAVL